MTMAGQRDRSALPLSAVPLLFGIQQACEGLVWVGINHENFELTQSAALVYLFFALTFWLFWIPFSATFLEPRKKIKILLGLAATLGQVGGLGFYVPILLNPDALVVRVVHHSVRFDITQFDAMEVIPQLVWQFCYLAVVSLPLFLVAQNRKGLIAFSTALVISAAISHAYFWYAFASVWCFFAALLSMVLVYVFHHLTPRTLKISAIALVESISRPTIHH